MALIIMVGSALFWTNLNDAGHGDPRTLHAGCPVISGHKVGIWNEVMDVFTVDIQDIANLWFYYKGQDLSCKKHGKNL